MRKGRTQTRVHSYTGYIGHRTVRGLFPLPFPAQWIWMVFRMRLIGTWGGGGDSEVYKK